MPIYLIELQYRDADDVPRTLYLSMSGYTSKPSDTPSNQYYSDRVKDAGLFSQQMFSAGRTSGDADVGYGDIVFINNKPYGYDELIDEWVTWSFAGHPIVIKHVANATSPLSSAVIDFVGTADQLVTTDALNEFSLKIRDRLDDLNQPLLTERYLGTTTSGGITPGAEGNSDLQDQIKQMCWGSCEAVPCAAVNPYELIYQVSNGPVVSITVSDGGFALTNAGDFASLASLRAWVQVPGQYVTCKTLGLFRLGYSADSTVSADVVEGATAADRTAAQIARRKLLHFGIDTSNIVTAAFTALDVKNSAVCGSYVDDETVALDSIQDDLRSIGATIFPNNLGQYTVARLEAPAVSASASFELDDDLNASPTRTDTGDEGNGVPTYRVTVRYRKVFQEHSGGDIAGGVSAERATFLGQEYREVMVEDLTVLERFPNAPEIVIDTLLTTRAAALAEATRLLALHSVQRELWILSRPLDQIDTLALGDTVEIVSAEGRMELGEGKNFIVLGKTVAYGDADTIPNGELHCWG